MKRVMTGLGVMLSLVMAVPASAQDRGFLRAVVGATVGTETGAAFGGTVGFKISPRATILVEGGGLTNVLPKKVTDQVDVAAAVVANLQGGKASSSAKATATYGLFGVRINAGALSRAMSFFEIGAGVGHVKSTVHAVIRGSESLQGDISSKVITPFTSNTPETKLMMAVGYGIVLGVTKSTAVEMGYRYLHIFTESISINTSKVFGAVKFGF
jgi:opacity protein-like surface antigen